MNILRLTTRDVVNALETEMFKMPELDLTATLNRQIKHHFSPGVYARELFIPAGTLLTGKIHKFEHLNIMSQGDMSVMTEDGIKRVQAPFTVVSPAGTKRIAFAHSDTVWTTIHATEETDIDKIEGILVTDSEADYSKFILAVTESNRRLL
jgi:hypothetical protein